MLGTGAGKLPLAPSFLQTWLSNTVVFFIENDEFPNLKVAFYVVQLF